MATLLTKHLTTLDQLTKISDVFLKATASVVAAAWALNRYFTARVDELKLSINSDVSVVPAGGFGDTPELGLLIVRLEVVNTGNSLVPDFDQFLVADEIYPTRDGVGERTLWRWPETGLHSGGLIEPGSWSAINTVHCISASTRVVRLYLEIHMDEAPKWSWHKTFKIERASEEAGPASPTRGDNRSLPPPPRRDEADTL
jgi:hypothetical protein